MVFSLEKVFETPVIKKLSSNDSGQNITQPKAKAPDIISTSTSVSRPTSSAILLPMMKAPAPSTDNKAMRAMLDNRPMSITEAVTRVSPKLNPADQQCSSKLLEKKKVYHPPAQKSPPSSTNQLPLFKENCDQVKPLVQPSSAEKSFRDLSSDFPLKVVQPDTKAPVRKCRVCRQPLRGHKGPSGVGKCVNTLGVKSFIEDISESEQINHKKCNKQQPIYNSSLSGSNSSSFLDDLEIISESLVTSVPDNTQVALDVPSPNTDQASGGSSSSESGQVLVGGWDVTSKHCHSLPGLELEGDAGLGVQGHGGQVQVHGGSSFSVSGQVSGSSSVSMSNILVENVSSSLEASTMEGSVQNSLQGKVSKKRKVSGEIKLKKKKKKSNGSAFEYFRPMQEWQNFFAREDLTTNFHQLSSGAQVSENHENVRTAESESTADTLGRHQGDLQVHVPAQAQPALHVDRGPAQLPPAQLDQQAAADVAALHSTRNKAGRGRPVRKCNLGKCSFCSIEENCGLCKYCKNPQLKAKCSARQCPRLNKRHCHPSKSTEEVKRILDDLINDVSDPKDIHEESITNEGNNFEQSGEESVVPIVRGNMREVWICPICSVHIRHRQNIARHQSVNCSAVKVPKLKPAPVPKPESKCDVCGVIFLCKTNLTAHMKRLHLEFYCQINKHNLFQCSKCDFKCTAERFLKAHIQRFHSEKGSYICDYCDRRYFTKDTLRVHIKRSHINVQQTYICHVCGSVCLSENDLKKHSCESATAPDSNAEINVQNPSPVHPQRASSKSAESVLSHHEGLAEVGKQVPNFGPMVQSQVSSQVPLKENNPSTRLFYQRTSNPFFVNQTSAEPVTGYNGAGTQTEIVRGRVMSCAAETPAGHHQGDVQVLAQECLSLHVPLHSPVQAQGYPHADLHGYKAPAHHPLGWPNQHVEVGVHGPVQHAVQHQDAVLASSELRRSCFAPDSHPVESSCAQVMSRIPINQNYLHTFNLGYQIGDEQDRSAGYSSPSNFAISNINNNSEARIMANNVWVSGGERVVDIFDAKGKEYVNL